MLHKDDIFDAPYGKVIFKWKNQNRFLSELSNVHKDIAEYIKSQHVILEDNHYRLTPEGRLLADRIASDLFLVEE